MRLKVVLKLCCRNETSFHRQRVCQDDCDGEDHSRWRFEGACDQHSVDKVLCNHGEHCVNKNSPRWSGDGVQPFSKVDSRIFGLQ